MLLINGLLSTSPGKKEKEGEYLELESNKHKKKTTVGVKHLPSLYFNYQAFSEFQKKHKGITMV